MDKVKLLAPEGCTSCNHEGVEYKVDEKTGTVDVPAAAAAALIESHGFKVAPAKK